MIQIESRLAELGLTLPQAPAPAANYVPFVTVGALVHIGSGQKLGVIQPVSCY